MQVDICLFDGIEQPTCTSLDVALTFEKRHKDVLRTIRGLGCDDEFRRRNFGPSYYINAQGKKQPMYIMTRSGFTMTVAKFTGEKADAFLQRYINEFERMADELNNRQLAEVQRQATRRIGIATRRTLTDEIRDSGENDRMHGHGYSTFSRMVHRIALGEGLNDTRKRLGLSKKDNVRDHLTEPELKRLDAVERAAAGLLAVGFPYGSIRQILEGNALPPAEAS